MRSGASPAAAALLGLCLLVSAGRVVRADTNTAVVSGTERLLLRRGPGPGFAPFATLTRGSPVQVQETQGQWARVVTPGGQIGYVKSSFLTVSHDKEKHTKPQAAPTPASTPAAAAGNTAPTLKDTNRDLEAEVRRLREQLATLQSSMAQTPTPDATTPTPSPVANVADGKGDERVHVELARLTAVVEGLRARLEPPPPSDPGPLVPNVPFQDAARPVSSAAVLLGLGGLGIGWLMGSMLGRRDERGRRKRIRF